jgi:two-component system chemotaxis sensor kinase CheA
VGQLTITASLRGSELELVIADDGRGLNLSALRARAERMGLPPPADDTDAARLVFVSGLSTAPSVTPIAGRGVGLDAVRRSVEAMHGTVKAVSDPGRGTRFHLRVPLIVSTLRCMVVAAGEQKLAIPCSQVGRVVHVRARELFSVESAQTISVAGAAVPVLALSHVLGLKAAPTRDSAPALLLSGEGRTFAFVVDELLSEGESVLRPLPPRMQGTPNFSGVAKLTGGQFALVLHGGDLCRAALRVLFSGTAALPLSAPTKPARILVVDDSLTTRTLLKSVLEGAGYEVVTASDGAEAWRLLQHDAFSVIVSDVQMPNMDGVTLTQMIRRSAALARVPVVLVTALGSDEEKQRGLDAGATAYLVKTAFDQQALLEAVARHA